MYKVDYLIKYNTFTGKERDEETGYSYFGARYYDSGLPNIFLSVDPMSDKYPGISPYAYCAWNPVKLVDLDGREIVIIGRKGGKTTYTPNMSSDGLDKFTRRAIDALNVIYSNDEGKSLIDDLCESSNSFKIEKSYSSGFLCNDPQKAYKVQMKTDPLYSDLYNAYTDKSKFDGGSGGTISWNNSGDIIPTTNGGTVNAIIDLAHELFHAKDANHGMLDSRLEDGLKRSEWQAVYNENILRGQMNLPLRTHHGVILDGNGTYLGGDGPSMLNNGQPIKPKWL